MKTSNPLAILLFSVFAINAAHADAVGEAQFLTVHFADLDLAKPEGAVTLFGRIRRAAKTVCAPLDGASARQKQEYASCVNFALTNAVGRVNQPMLSEYVINRLPAQATTKTASAR